jgi:hypothetical protein
MNIPPPSGSPILARVENKGVLPIVAVIAIAVVLLIIIGVQIYRQILQTYARQSHSDRHKTRITNKRDVRFAAKEYSFTREESDYLYAVCKKNKVPNIRFFLKDHERTTRLFKTAYKDTLGETDPVTDQSLIFSMYEKINKSRLAYTMMSSTSSLHPGQKLLYIDPDGKKYMTNVVDSNESELIIATPKDKTGNEIMLQDLSKITLMIQGKNEIAFTASVRVIRYQVKSGDPVVVTTHANHFQPFIKHEYVYTPARIPCLLQQAAAKSAPRTAETVEYEAEGRTYNGILLNYSGMSCNIVIKNTINVHQILKLKTKFNGQDIDNLIIMVMNVVPNEEERAFLIHANFVKIPEQTKNYILSHVYSFVG